MEKTDLPDITLTKDPEVDPTVYIAPGARVMGDVAIGAESSVWYNTVVRGDINYIKIGERTNLQDGCIVHLENDLPCIVGNDVTVGHGAILHGCTIEDGVLIGMGATILSGARIGRGSMIAAGAVVLEGSDIPPFSLLVGIPAKIRRELPAETYDKHLKWANKYKRLARLHQAKYGSEAILR